LDSGSATQVHLAARVRRRPAASAALLEEDCRGACGIGFQRRGRTRAPEAHHDHIHLMLDDGDLSLG